MEKSAETLFDIKNDAYPIPKVSIGLAVYNGETYLSEAIESILAQTFNDFELIISDNASTDQTEAICKEYQAKDPRIRYSRNSTNIGGANNENLTFRLSRGKYFRWAAHDDLCMPDLLIRLVEVLDTSPTTILAYSEIKYIDENGNELAGKSTPIKGLADKPSQRFKDLYTLSHDCETTYGLIRSDIMRKTDLQHNYTDSDRTFLCELSLYGQFKMVSGKLFCKRIHPQMSTQIYANWRERMAWFGSAASTKKTSPYLSQFLDYLQVITRSPISLIEKCRCYLIMVLWVARYRRWLYMLQDLFMTIFHFMNLLFLKKPQP